MLSFELTLQKISSGKRHGKRNEDIWLKKLKTVNKVISDEICYYSSPNMKEVNPGRSEID